MLYNWSRFALNELFVACGAELADEATRARLTRFGTLGVRPLLRACYAYLGKLQQCRSLLDTLPDTAMTTLCYEDLVTHRDAMMRALFEFTELPLGSAAGGAISTRSLGKADRLSAREGDTVDALCGDAYEACLDEAIRLRP